jgi:hypothetical protein
MEWNQHAKADAPVPDSPVDHPRASSSIAGGPAPATLDGDTTAIATTNKPPASLLSHDSVDSGVDAGSSSEYDQENHGDHVIEAQEEGNFSDEG